MRMLKRGSLLSWTAGALVLAGSLSMSAFASGSESGNGLDFKYMYYWDRNGVWNHTPTFAFFHRLPGFFKLQWNQEFDAVSGASRRLGLRNVGRLGDHDQVLDGITGASRREIRHSEQATVSYGNQGRAASGSFYYSDENDYTSYSPAATGAWDFNDRNTTLSGSWALFLDNMHPQGNFAGQGGDRRIHAFNVGLSQVLSPLSLVSVAISPIRSTGYLGHPYNPVVTASGAMMTEELPAKKISVALTGKWVQGYLFGERLGSVHFEARHYRDDWKLVSNTVDVQWHQNLTEGTYLRLRTRWYRQGAAAFFRKSYAGDEVYRTADFRFSSLSTLTVGLKAASTFPESWGESAFLPDRWDIGYDHGLRNTKGQEEDLPAVPDERILRPLSNYQLYGTDAYYQQGTFMAGLGFDF